MEKLPSVLMRF